MRCPVAAAVAKRTVPRAGVSAVVVPVAAAVVPTAASAAGLLLAALTSAAGLVLAAPISAAGLVAAAPAGMSLRPGSVAPVDLSTSSAV
ncbi:hypothetical protein PUN28_004297 [Cardiocondyla obscurior]|uniref:Uncharacterized protein n=1 Tax=Cardiocondyla obscurior TaxID=286306 RepID=A0AAW2GF19_9HYME